MREHFPEFTTPENLDQTAPERPPEINPPVKRPRLPEEPTPQHRADVGPDRPAYSDTDLTPAERQEKEKVEQEVQAALRELHAMLKSQERVTGSEIVAAIDQTSLAELTLPFKRQLASVIEGGELQTKDCEAFVQSGLEALGFWIYMQGLKRGTERDLDANASRDKRAE